MSAALASIFRMDSISTSYSLLITLTRFSYLLAEVAPDLFLQAPPSAHKMRGYLHVDAETYDGGCKAT